MPDVIDPLEGAIRCIGLLPLARGLNVSHQAIRKWQKRGRMPRTEWTGETDYSRRIAELTGHRVTRQQLLAPWPKPAVEAPAGQGATACTPAASA